MNEHPFSRLIDLVEYDQKLHSINNAVAIFDNDIAALKAEQHNNSRIVQELHKRLVSCKKNVDLQELEMKTLDTQEREKKVLLERISEYKQYQSVKTEIETLQKQQLAQEQAVLDAWAGLEAVQEEHAKRQRETIVEDERLNALLQDKENKRSLLIGEYDLLAKNRIEKETTVPAEWLEKYNIMHSRVSDPVVQVISGVCSACSSIIVPSDMARIKHGALMQCKSCFRLLYLPEAMERR